MHMVQPALLGSDTADLPTPQQHLGAGNGSPAPAGVMGQLWPKRSLVFSVLSSLTCSLQEHLGTGSPGLERFKMLWPLPSGLLRCNFKV